MLILFESRPGSRLVNSFSVSLRRIRYYCPTSFLSEIDVFLVYVLVIPFSFQRAIVSVRFFRRM